MKEQIHYENPQITNGGLLLKMVYEISSYVDYTIDGYMKIITLTGE